MAKKKAIPRPNTIVIMVSDVHIGAMGSNHAQFKTFLMKLSNPDLYPNLKMLIIGGDILDVIFESAHGLREHFKDIFAPLLSIQERGIKIVFLLGNHEIPVTGPYEVSTTTHTPEDAKLNFSLPPAVLRERRDWFHKHLGDAGPMGSFIDHAVLCQYVILERAGNQWQVIPLDSIQELGASPPMILSFPAAYAPPNSGAIKMLACHGFQCDHDTDEWGGFWQMCLTAPEDLKDILDLLYYVFREALGTVLIPDVWGGDSPNIKNFNKLTPDAQQKVRDVQARLKSDPTQQAKFGDYASALVKVANRKRGRDGPKICENAVSFIGKHPELAGITHFLFGHTHQVYDEKIGTIQVINTGAWQRVSRLTHVEIDDTGNYEILQIKARWFKASWLVGFILIIIGVVLVLKWILPK